MHTSEQGVGSAIEELQGDVPAHVSQQVVVAHAERIPGIVAAGVPTVHRRHGGCIRRDECRDREDAVAVIAAPCGQGRNHGMAQPRQHAFALTAVVQRVFFEGLGQRITRGGAYGCYAKVGPESLAITLCASPPVRRCIPGLVKARREGGADDGIRAERVEELVVDLRLLRRTRVRQVELRRGSDGNSAGGISRIEQ